MIKKNKQEFSSVIVTGATGFIGQNLVPLLLENNYEVIAVIRDCEKVKKFEWCKDVRLINHDIHQNNPLIDLTPSTGLIHLAWGGLSNYNAPFHLEENLPHNYNFIKSLVLRGLRQVLVAGTCLEYGLQNGPICSSKKTEPVNPYALSKDMLRKSLEQVTRHHPLIVQWARIFYIYGKGQPSKSILSQLDYAIDNKLEIFNMTLGEQLRDYLPVEKVVRQLFDLFESRKKGVFNICSGQPIAIKDLVQERISSRKSNIKVNLGYYPCPSYEPMAFWGIRDIGETIFLPSLPNAPLLSANQKQTMGPVRLRYNKNLHFLENEAFDSSLIDYSVNYENSQAYSLTFILHMKNVLNLIKTMAPYSREMVEVGCGKGDFVALVQDDGQFNIVGFDAAYDGFNPLIKKRYLTPSDKINTDVVVLRHVLEHIKNPYQFLSMLSSIFKNAKIFIEVPNYDWILENETFFDITYEHVNYFSQKSLNKLFNDPQAKNGLLFNNQYQYIFADLGTLNPEFNIFYESKEWVYQTFDLLFPNMKRKIEEIEKKLKNNSLYIWGAATKGCLFLAHCAFMGKLIKNVKFAVDINEKKIGNFLPGTQIEIKGIKNFIESVNNDDVLLISNPNYQNEIEQQIKDANILGLIVMTL